MADFVDELPPATGKANNRDLKEFAAELRANPGRWAKYPRPLATLSSASMTGSLIRNGRMASFSDGPFEAEARLGRLYVRYPG